MSRIKSKEGARVHRAGYQPNLSRIRIRILKYLNTKVLKYSNTIKEGQEQWAGLYVNQSSNAIKGCPLEDLSGPPEKYQIGRKPGPITSFARALGSRGKIRRSIRSLRLDTSHWRPLHRCKIDACRARIALASQTFQQIWFLESSICRVGRSIANKPN